MRGARPIRRATAVCRLAIAVLLVAALIGRYQYGVGNITFSTGNYFAYLTIQSNLAALAMFAVGGVRMWRGDDESRAWSAVRLLVTSCLVVAGSVFIVLVVQSPNFGYPIGVPWSDAVLHFVIPAYAILDWALAPGRHATRWALAPALLGYPVVWGLITLWRGQSVGWYPYFFLDPNQMRSFGEFAGYSSIALSVFLVVALLLTWLSRVVRPLVSPLEPAPGEPAPGEPAPGETAASERA
jgi:hypothetical protein